MTSDMNQQIIIGLDLSLRGSAACRIPITWKQQISVPWVMTIGEKLTADANEEARVSRLSNISNDLIEFCWKHFQGISHKHRHIFLEDYAFAATGAHVRSIAELTGVVKWRLYEEFSIVVQVVAASRARKVLLQHLPRKDVKAYVTNNVRRLGVTWNDDEIDAFVIANYGVMMVGGCAMTFDGR